MTGRCKSLLMSLQSAFGNTPLPDATDTVIPTRDDEGTEEVFSGKRVDNIPQESFVSHCTALWFFTDDALVYYLPGFMTAALQGADAQGVIWGHVYAQLCDERRPALLDKLNEAQRLCILEFCRCCGALDEDIASLMRSFTLHPYPCPSRKVDP